ncbi:hypothetical protein AV530_007826 [Patagioenas fasciata monilis]|uniref:Uncharacterized protein n=1 Tax=Patagioenas fasciata monilis TaxID=372326 RepID=A0A1V4JT21_PATFA|nr:hypothetical protein AV530_007826 [Patagioenas fasciata monilis]
MSVVTILQVSFHKAISCKVRLTQGCWKTQDALAAGVTFLPCEHFTWSSAIARKSYPNVTIYRGFLKRDLKSEGCLMDAAAREPCLPWDHRQNQQHPCLPQLRRWDHPKAAEANVSREMTCPSQSAAMSSLPHLWHNEALSASLQEDQLCPRGAARYKASQISASCEQAVTDVTDACSSPAPGKCLCEAAAAQHAVRTPRTSS